AAPVLRAAELYEGAAPAFRRDWEAARREGALRALVMTCAVLVVVGLLAAYAAGYLPWLRPRL
ncbi:hypothetical protein, partial [Deinococcus pimensis]|uniref:hypothetical protein n=1 Tax=Deinococcus pimensis TaxID=309888 RepID=UPI0004860AF2